MKRYDAFTLIEMLTVIAIVAVLAALLLPVLQTAKRAGSNAQCQSNLRQVGIAIAAYCADFNDYIPKRLPAFSPMTAKAATNWFDSTAWAATERHKTDSLMSYIVDPRVLHCPDSMDYAELSYGVNGRVVDFVSNYSEVKSPSETPMSFDASQTVSYYYSDLNFRHGADVNALYADGHVEPRYLDVLFRVSDTVPLPGAEWGIDTPRGGKTATLLVRVSGTNWDEVSFLVYENGKEYGQRNWLREDGSPNDEMQPLGPYWLDPKHRTYQLEIELIGLDKGGGSNPIWFAVAGYDGKLEKIAEVNKNHSKETVDITQILRKMLYPE